MEYKDTQLSDLNLDGTRCLVMEFYEMGEYPQMEDDRAFFFFWVSHKLGTC